MNSEERDLIIRLDQKLSDLCTQNTKAHDLMAETQKDQKMHCDKTTHRCDRRFNEKVNTKIMFWVLSFVMAVISISGILDYNIRSNIEERLDGLEKAMYRIEATVNAQKTIEERLDKILNKINK